MKKYIKEYTQIIFISCIILAIVSPYLGYCTITHIWNYVNLHGEPSAAYLWSHIKVWPDVNGPLGMGSIMGILVFLYIPEMLFITLWCRQSSRIRTILLIIWTLFLLGVLWFGVRWEYLYMLRTA